MTMRGSCRCIGSTSPGPRARTCGSITWSMSSTCRISVIWSSSSGKPPHVLDDEVGEGKMTLVESHPNDVIKIKTDFVKPFEGTMASEFAFKQDGEQTAVTWAMAGHHNFIEKAFCL